MQHHGSARVYGGLEFLTHQALAAELWRLRAQILAAQAVVLKGYGNADRKARLAKRVVDALDVLRANLSHSLLSEHSAQPTAVLSTTYYPPEPPRMSQPHANEVTLRGDVDGFHHGPDGRIVGIVLRVDVGEVALIPVLPARPLMRLQKGDRLWLRGELRSMRCPGERHALVYVVPTHLELVKRKGA